MVRKPLLPKSNSDIDSSPAGWGLRLGWVENAYFNLVLSCVSIYVGIVFQPPSVASILISMLVGPVVYIFTEVIKPESDFGLLQFCIGLPLQSTIVYCNARNLGFRALHLGTGCFLIFGSFFYAYRVNKWKMKRDEKESKLREEKFETEKKEEEPALRHVEELEEEEVNPAGNLTRTIQQEIREHVRGGSNEKKGIEDDATELEFLRGELKKVREQRQLDNKNAELRLHKLKESNNQMLRDLNQLREELEKETKQRENLEKVKKQELKKAEKWRRAPRHIKTNIEELIKKAKVAKQHFEKLKRAPRHIKTNTEELIKKAKDAKQNLEKLKRDSERLIKEAQDAKRRSLPALENEKKKGFEEH